MWVATQDLPRSAAHPFYTRLNQILDTHDFDGYVEGLCQRFYADEGRPGLPPGRYFRLLPIGYFEGLDVTLEGGLPIATYLPLSLPMSLLNQPRFTAASSTGCKAVETSSPKHWLQWLCRSLARDQGGY